MPRDEKREVSVNERKTIRSCIDQGCAGNWISILCYLDTYSKAFTFPTQQFLQIQFAKGDILA